MLAPPGLCPDLSHPRGTEGLCSLCPGQDIAHKAGRVSAGIYTWKVMPRKSRMTDLNEKCLARSPEDVPTIVLL